MSAIENIMNSNTNNISKLESCSIYSLPPEIILVIVERVDIFDLPGLVCALYPVLSTHNIAGQVSRWEALALKRASPTVTCSPTGPCLRLSGTGLPALPMELRLQLYRYLNPADKVNLAVATMWMHGHMETRGGLFE